jgi:DNA-binding MarR family transcriptional regulator
VSVEARSRPSIRRWRLTTFTRAPAFAGFACTGVKTVNVAAQRLTREAYSYLEAISGLEQGDEVASNGRVAAAVGVTPASATVMVQRLAARGLVEYARRRPVRLTRAGREELGLWRARRERVERTLRSI